MRLCRVEIWRRVRTGPARPGAVPPANGKGSHLMRHQGLMASRSLPPVRSGEVPQLFKCTCLDYCIAKMGPAQNAATADGRFGPGKRLPELRRHISRAPTIPTDGNNRRFSLARSGVGRFSKISPKIQILPRQRKPHLCRCRAHPSTPLDTN